MSEQESWRTILGFEGWYEVSNYGRVRRIREGSRTWPGRVLKLQLYSRGRLGCLLFRNGKRTHALVSRLVAEAFLGSIPKTMHVHHVDGDVTNNHVDNLQIVSPSKHAYIAYQLGQRSARGVNNGRSKLTPELVRAIRTDVADGATQASVAKRLGLHQSTISKVISKRYWAHIV